MSRERDSLQNTEKKKYWSGELGSGGHLTRKCNRKEDGFPRLPYGYPYFPTLIESVTVRKMGSPGSLMVTHISQQVNLLFSDYGKNFEKMAKVAIVYKYEFCPLSFKTKIKSLGWKLSELLALEENPHPLASPRIPSHPPSPSASTWVAPPWVALKNDGKKRCTYTVTLRG